MNDKKKMNPVVTLVLVILALAFGVVGLIMGTLAYVKAEDAESASDALTVPEEPYMLLQPKEDLSGLEWVSRPIVRSGHLPVTLKHVFPNERIQSSTGGYSADFVHGGDLKIENPSKWFMHPGDRIHVRMRMQDFSNGSSTLTFGLAPFKEGETTVPIPVNVFRHGGAITYADPFLFEGDLIYEGATTGKARSIGCLYKEKDHGEMLLVDHSMATSDFDIMQPFSFRVFGRKNNPLIKLPIVREIWYTHHPAHEGATPMDFDY